MSGFLSTVTFTAIAIGLSSVRSFLPGMVEPTAIASTPHRPIYLVDRVVDGSDFDQFRHRLRRAVQRRDTAFLYSTLPPEGVMIGNDGPVPPQMLALENANSPFWRSLEKMLAPESCELESYPGSAPDAAIWGCPNIASAFTQQHPALGANDTAESLNHVVIVGRYVNVRALPQLGTPVVGQLSNEVVEFDQRTWSELLATRPEVIDDPIEGWTPVILPNFVRGYIYNRYVYHPLGPRALFENVAGQWRLVRIMTSDEPTMP